MRPRRWLVFLFALLALAGCRPELQTSGGSDRPKIYNSAVSLSPSTTEIMMGKAYYVKLSGRTASCNHPGDLSKIPVVMNGVEPNFESIRALKPDAVVYDPSLISEADVAKLKEGGYDLFSIGGDTVKDFTRELYILGAAMAAETNIMDYVGDIEGAVAKARAVQPKPAPRIAILMPDPRGAHYIAGTRTFLADIVRICGGEIVGPDSNKFELANIENLTAWNPSLIACTPSYKAIVDDPRLQSIQSVRDFKAGKVSLVEVKADILLRRGIRVDSLIDQLSKFIGGRIGD